MKILKSLFLILASALFCACSVTQELSDDEVSFKGLKNFYVADAGGADYFFKTFGDTAEMNAELKNEIVVYLESKGFKQVADKSDAQIIFRPLWSVSIRSSDETRNSLPINVVATNQSTLNVKYATLEIQAIIPDDGKLWAWRGFAPNEITQSNYAVGALRNMVVWCFENFPPEEHPSKLQEYKKQKETKRIEAEQNPYKEVLIKERERQEAAAKADAKK